MDIRNTRFAILFFSVLGLIIIFLNINSISESSRADDSDSLINLNNLTGFHDLKYFACQPNSENIAVINYGTLDIWSIPAERQLISIPMIGVINAIAWAPDGHDIVINEHGIFNDTIHVYHWKNNSLQYYASYHTNYRNTCFYWSSSGNLLAIGTENGTVLIYNIKNWSLQRVYQPSLSDPIQIVSVSPSNQYLIVGLGLDLFIYNFSNNQIETHQRFYSPSAISWNSNGSSVAIGNRNGNSIIYYLEDRLVELGHFGTADVLVWRPNSSIIYFGYGGAGNIEIYNLSNGTSRQIAFSSSDGHIRFDWLSSCSFLITGGTDNIIRSWVDLSTSSVHPFINISVDDFTNPVSGIFNCKGNATGYPSISSVLWRIDGQDWNVANGTDRWDFSIATVNFINGTHVVQIRGFNQVWLSEPVSLSLIIDNGWIDITISQPLENSTVSGNVTIKGSTNGSPYVLIVQVSVDKVRWYDAQGILDWIYTFDSMLFIDGEHRILVRGLNSNGLQCTTGIDLVFNNSAHSNPLPPCVIVSPTDNSIVRGALPVYGSFPVSISEDIHVWWRMDNGSWSEAHGDKEWIFFLDTQTYSDGYHKITVRGSAGDRNSPERSIELLFDNGLHHVVLKSVIVSPSNGTAVWGFFDIVGTVDFVTDGAKIELRIDNVTRLNNLTKKDWEINVRSFEIPDGPCEIRVREIIGTQVGAWCSILVSIENAAHAPLIVVERPLDNAILSGSSIEVKGFVLAYVPVQYVKVRLSNDTWTSPWVIANGTMNWSCTIDIEGLRNGNYYLNLICSNEYQSSRLYSVPISIYNEEQGHDGSDGLLSIPGPYIWGFVLIAVIVVVLTYGYMKWNIRERD